MAEDEQPTERIRCDGDPRVTALRAAFPSFVDGVEELGRGGCGVVRVGRQLDLDREVAIKAVPPQCDDPGGAAARLLREARVIGALEHPNIVPIHALQYDSAGRPVLVMKRIEGTGWDELLAARVSCEERLDRNLAILAQLARTLSFAHSRGIVHRDVKPGNVMIGSFGEMVLIDWGLAVRTCHSHLSDVPLARDVDASEGSPAYMAPEMAGANGELIDERTDVYLLGGALHEILTGHPPHRGSNMRQILTSAIVNETPLLPSWVPSQLVRLCVRALRTDPHDRFPSAAAFAEELELFLSHRGSIRLAEESWRPLHKLRDALRSETAELHRVHALFGECRFGFAQALQIWPENRQARLGLQLALELMIRHELARGSATVASVHLADLPEPRPKLADEVAQALTADAPVGETRNTVSSASFPVGRRRLFVLSVVLLVVQLLIATGTLLAHAAWR
jgi:serine/threonine-protein kinase